MPTYVASAPESARPTACSPGPYLVSKGTSCPPGAINLIPGAPPAPCTLRLALGALDGTLKPIADAAWARRLSGGGCGTPSLNGPVASFRPGMILGKAPPQWYWMLPKNVN